ncbi:MAG: hypothetical protein K2O18_06090 [Oscillospiraceae bacterium]|nr:hypothetical protein [Oscillospiraceae bacterium]
MEWGWDPLSTSHVAENLKDAGCSADMTAQFLQLMEKGTLQDQMRLLRKHRITLMDDMHAAQKRVDCLDYLIYQLSKRHEKIRTAP